MMSAHGAIIPAEMARVMTICEQPWLLHTDVSTSHVPPLGGSQVQAEHSRSSFTT
jgi:hypothetical protein